MNGISCLVSKSLCWSYNPVTSNKPGIFPNRPSNFHLKSTSPLLTTRCTLKHGVSSLSADNKAGTRSSFKLPEVRGTSVAHILLGLLGITGLALLKAREAVAVSIEGSLKPNAPCFKYFMGCVWFFIAYFASGYLARIICGLKIVLHDKPFSIGDIIQVGSLEGKVIEMGLLTTELVSKDNVPILVPYTFYTCQPIVNKSRAAWYPMVSKIRVQVDEIEKIPKIEEEIVKMMKSYSNVYLEEKQPYCYLSGFERKRDSVELTLGCNLKPMGEKDLHKAKVYVVSNAAELIKKQGAIVGEHVREAKSAKFLSL